MKQKNKFSLEESTLFQDIVNTYRYPDGTLNKIAVSISTLALVLLLILGHFMILGIKNLKGMKSVSASELTLNEIEEYITGTYLDAVDEYSKQELDPEATKRKILSHIAEYLLSSEAFTTEQKEEILNSIEAYLQEMNLDESINNNSEAIEKINNIFEKYINENAATLELLKTDLKSEIESNHNYTNEQLTALKDLNKQLSELELTHWTSINNHLSETIQKFDYQGSEIYHNMTSGLKTWEAGADYPINSYVIYNVGADYEQKNNVTENANDIRIYVNITGNNTSVPPTEDKTNWKEVSLATAIEDNYNTMISDLYEHVDEWMAGKDYKIDQYVTYNNKLYQNITGEYNADVNPENDSANWKEISIVEAIENLYNNLFSKLYEGLNEWSEISTYKPNDYVLYKHKLYRNLTGTNTSVTPDLDNINWSEASITTVINNNFRTFLSVTGAQDYDQNASYSDGDYVIYNNIIYKNVSANPTVNNANSIPGVSNGEGSLCAWVPVSLTEIIDNNYSTFINTLGATDYNPNSNYQAGDYVIYNGLLYQNITGENSTPGSSEDWQSVSVTNSLDTLRMDLDALAIKSESDLTNAKNTLTNVITNNKNLTDEEMARMLQKINDNDDATKESMNNLADDLTSVINENATLSANERAALLGQINALRSSTATDLLELRNSTDESITNLSNSTTKSLTDLKNSTDKNILDLSNQTTQNINNLKSETSNSINSLKSETTNNINKLKTETTNSIDSLRKYVDKQDTNYYNLSQSGDAKLQGDINKINDRLSDNNKEFEFRYKNGCYGYYVNDTFYPF